MKRKVIITLVFLIFTFILAFILSTFIQTAMYLKENHQSMEVNYFISKYIIFLKNPISTIKMMFNSMNPIWILSCIGSIIASLYVGFIKSKGKKFEIESSYTVHGAARWGAKSEYKGFLEYVNQDYVIKEFFEGISDE